MTEITDQHIRDAGKVLGKSSLLDPRMPKPDENSVAAWAEILAERGAGLTADDLLPAVVLHYATSTERLMPAELIRLARERRRENFERSPLDSPERLRLEAAGDAKAEPDELSEKRIERKQALAKAAEAIGHRFGNLDRPVTNPLRDTSRWTARGRADPPAPVPCPDCASINRCEHDDIDAEAQRDEQAAK